MHILLLCPDEKDATSFYRGWGPFGDLARNSEIPLFLHRALEVSWSAVVDKQLVVLQRPYLSNHLEILKIVARTGVRTWVDWDDLLWQVPDGNPAKVYYENSSEIYTRILQCAQLADVVTVSTESLKHAFPNELHAKIHVLHNRLPQRWQYRTPHQKPKDQIWIAWRGTRTHEADWIDFVDTVLDVSRSAKVGWRIIGTAPQWVIEQLSSVVPLYHHKEIPMERYFEWFIKEGPQADILFVPLRDNVFNRAKSNIAYLEATFGGMLCVGPRWEEWMTGISAAEALLYTSPQHAKDCLLQACVQAHKGAFTLINSLQEHFLTQFQQDCEIFRKLVYDSEGDEA